MAACSLFAPAEASRDYKTPMVPGVLSPLTPAYNNIALFRRPRLLPLDPLLADVLSLNPYRPADGRRFAAAGGTRHEVDGDGRPNRHAAEHRPVLAQALDPVPNIDGSFRIQEPLGGMFFVELCLERLPLIQPTKAITSKIRVNSDGAGVRRVFFGNVLRRSSSWYSPC